MESLKSGGFGNTGELVTVGVELWGTEVFDSGVRERKCRGNSMSGGTITFSTILWVKIKIPIKEMMLGRSPMKRCFDDLQRGSWSPGAGDHLDCSRNFGINNF